MNNIKIWKLNTTEFVTTRIEYIKNIGCGLDIIPLQTKEIPWHTGHIRVIVEAQHLKITTDCEKQEMMLKLMFGDELHLVATWEMVSETI